MFWRVIFFNFYFYSKPNKFLKQFIKHRKSIEEGFNFSRINYSDRKSHKTELHRRLLFHLTDREVSVSQYPQKIEEYSRLLSRDHSMPVNWILCHSLPLAQTGNFVPRGPLIFSEKRKRTKNVKKERPRNTKRTMARDNISTLIALSETFVQIYNIWTQKRERWTKEAVRYVSHLFSHVK